MMNFISRNYLRILPLLVAGVVWAVGYVYVYKVAEFGICSPDAFDCWEVRGNIGFPARQLAHWLAPTALIALLTPYIFLKRWLVFAAAYLLLSFYAISQTSVGPFYGKETIAGLLGIILLAITILWLIVHLFISWRKTKKVALPTQ